MLDSLEGCGCHGAMHSTRPPLESYLQPPLPRPRDRLPYRQLAALPLQHGGEAAMGQALWQCMVTGSGPSAQAKSHP